MSIVSSTNWMKEIPNHTLIKDINIPGTHDSGTKYVKKDPKEYQCQRLSIAEQMQIGVRYFDIRCIAKDLDHSPEIVHGSIRCLDEYGNDLNLSRLVADAQTFLKNNPSETLIYQIKNEHFDLRLTEEWDKRLSYHINRYISQGVFWSQNRIPALGEVRGKIVLVRRFSHYKSHNIEKEQCGIDLSSWDSECNLKRNFNTFVHIKNTAYVQDRFLIDYNEKYPLLKKAIAEMNTPGSPPNAQWAICLSSCTNPTPSDAASIINDKLFYDPSLLNVRKLGTFVVDFAAEALIKKIYMTNFTY